MLEELLGNGIIEGKGAGQTAKIIREYLQEPNKFFRRVRNKETGELELSSKAISYNPGRGVYRSSQQNALRLALNETNMAYRRADHERWKENPAIIGFEVHLSGGHPTFDICDSLKGIYPKSFIWVGWHPRCGCFVTPIQMVGEEYEKYEDAILEGREDEYLTGVKQISTVPSGFKQWIQNNAERSKGWKSQPYFIQDNFIDGNIEKGLLIDAKIGV